MKKLLCIAILAMSTSILFSSVAMAANWKRAGVELKSGENMSLFFEGSATFSGGLGSVNCPSGVSATLQVTGGSGDGHVTSYAVGEPAKCTVGGLVGFSCGKNSLTAANMTGEPTLTDEETKIKVSNIDLDNTFGACTSLTLSGSITATPDSTTDVHELKLSGTLSTTAGGVTIGGALKTASLGL